MRREKEGEGRKEGKAEVGWKGEFWSVKKGGKGDGKIGRGKKETKEEGDRRERREEYGRWKGQREAEEKEKEVETV